MQAAQHPPLPPQQRLNHPLLGIQHPALKCQRLLAQYSAHLPHQQSQQRRRPHPLLCHLVQQRGAVSSCGTQLSGPKQLYC